MVEFIYLVEVGEYPGPKPPNWKRYDVSSIEQNGRVKCVGTYDDIGRAVRCAFTIAKNHYVQRVRFHRPLQSSVTCSISEVEVMLDYLGS